MKHSILKIVFFISLGIFLSCSSSEDPIPEVPVDPMPTPIFPSNLNVSVEILGVTSEFPDGDGSGTISVTASATDAVTYSFRMGDGSEFDAADGKITHTYTKRGTTSYTVYVFAYSSTGHSKSYFETVSVYVEPISYDTLVFSDEFDENGAPNDSKWGYNIGRGSDGWGNGEKQYYTDRSENVIIEDGLLKITAQKETYEGAAYTSTRMLTQDKFEFTYGKVEVRARLPKGVGTWPAIWMLGANIGEVGWPKCGEIDIMEHWGHNHGIVQSAMHNGISSGDTVNHGSQKIEDVSEEFHVYELYWTDEEMIFSVDGKQHYRYAPSNKNSDTWPYDADQFLIMNVAVGSSWFEVDPEFETSTLEVDYVRVYQ